MYSSGDPPVPSWYTPSLLLYACIAPTPTSGWGLGLPLIISCMGAALRVCDHRERMTAMFALHSSYSINKSTCQNCCALSFLHHVLLHQVFSSTFFSHHFLLDTQLLYQAFHFHMPCGLQHACVHTAISVVSTAPVLTRMSAMFCRSWLNSLAVSCVPISFPPSCDWLGHAVAHTAVMCPVLDMPTTESQVAHASHAVL